MDRILVTGAGGIGGVNFVRALRSVEKFFIIGTDHFPYHLMFNDLDKKYVSPRHDSPDFLPLIKEIINRDGVHFIHPQPEVEAEVISRHNEELNAVTYLPSPKIFDICRDKYHTAAILEPLGLAPKTKLYINMEKEGGEVWVRARKGAGGRLSLLCKGMKEVKAWVNLWVKRGVASRKDFIVQEYLPGRDFAWDSLWFEGKLVTSYARERLEYIFPHLSPSGLTGTPAVSKIIYDKRINEVSVRAVRAVDPKPHGFYCLDLKEGRDGKVYVTEINLKAHTTLALWSYIATKVLKMPKWGNISYLYTKIALGFRDFEEIPKFDIYPEGIILLRHIDVGAKILLPSGELKKVPL